LHERSDAEHFEFLETISPTWGCAVRPDGAIVETARRERATVRRGASADVLRITVTILVNAIAPQRPGAVVTKWTRIDAPAAPQGASRVPSLFRRRHVWLPTLWGTLLLSALAAALATFALRHLGSYLAVDAPAAGRDGGGARTLVVEGWLDDDALDDAIAVVARGRYERVVTSGGPIESWREGPAWPDYAERAADYLRRHGVSRVPVTAAPAPKSAQDRSFLSAVVVRDWLRRQGGGVDAIDLFSAGVHARRSRLVYRLAFGPDVEVGVFAARPRRYPLERWWATSDGAKSVLDEAIGLAWTSCCFWPPAPGSHEERRAVPKSPA
jgi:hypothetical protein